MACLKWGLWLGGGTGAGGTTGDGQEEVYTLASVKETSIKRRLGGGLKRGKKVFISDMFGICFPLFPLLLQLFALSTF